jgi:hypothetical protein
MMQHDNAHLLFVKVMKCPYHNLHKDTLAVETTECRYVGQEVNDGELYEICWKTAVAWST